MSVQHRELSAGRWKQLSFVEQMANIGGEIERALKWRAKNNPDYSQRAFERALELLDLTLDAHTEPPRLKETTRLREALVDFFAGENTFSSSDRSWRNYFLPFTYAARRNR